VKDFLQQVGYNFYPLAANEEAIKKIVVFHSLLFKAFLDEKLIVKIKIKKEIFAYNNNHFRPRFRQNSEAVTFKCFPFFLISMSTSSYVRMISILLFKIFNLIAAIKVSSHGLSTSTFFLLLFSLAKK